MHVNSTKELIIKIANLTMFTFCYEVVLRDFWTVKLPGVWKICYIPSDHRSGHILVKIKAQTVGDNIWVR
jgi:hypothetical protein